MVSIILYYDNEPGPLFTDSPLNRITRARDQLAHFMLGQSDNIYPELLDRSKAVSEYICEHKCYAIDEKGDAVNILECVKEWELALLRDEKTD
jgi:hypothetical protein